MNHRDSEKDFKNMSYLKRKKRKKRKKEMEKWWHVFMFFVFCFFKYIALERRVLGIITITFSKILEQLTGILLSCFLKVSPIHSVTILHVFVLVASHGFSHV